MITCPLICLTLRVKHYYKCCPPRATLRDGTGWRIRRVRCARAASLKQTNMYCQIVAMLLLFAARYTVRHNDILSLLVSWLTSVKSASQLLYADLSDTRVLPVCDLFTSCRPDLAIVDNNSIHILELTVYHETNLISSHDYKSNKYKNISSCGSSLALILLLIIMKQCFI